MNYVYSTLTADNEFSTPAGVVTIFGRLGARRRGKIDTPRGVATQVSDETVRLLREHPVFLAHENAGFVSVQTRELPQSKIDALVDTHMTKQDKAAQETPASIAKKTKAKRKKDE